MNMLPAAIEEAFKDAGFTQTEILIIRRLIEERSLPLRQLAAKTGKSTGVLDQAMRKLLKKGIVSKEMINEQPVYTFVSLDAIMKSIEIDTEKKHEMLQRRYENFEAFVQSLHFDKNRPEIESFEGPEGLKRAYCKLLGAGRELLVYQPTHTAEDPNLEDFRVQYFRERKRRNIFSRIIAHDTPHGRKFQSRDVFEFRKTLLVNAEQYPFAHEKLIIGSSVAYMNHVDQKASIIQYDELAHTERSLFEALWTEKSAAESASRSVASLAAQEDGSNERVTPAASIPWKVRTLSQLRNFFIGPQSLAVFAGFALIAGAITFGLYRQNVYLNTQRVRERVKAIAATAVLQFDWKDIEELYTIDDISKPEYSKVIYQLNEVRRQNEGVKYAYVLRKTDDEHVLEFVADADSIDPFAKKDLNGDGIIDESDSLNYPGQSYEVPDFSKFQNGFIEPSADDEPYTDQWGTFISGHAPILDDKGDAIAIIGIDMFADDISKLSQNTFSAVGTFFAIFLFFVFVRLAAFNRSLASELLKILKKRSTSMPIVLCFLLALVTTVLLAWHNADLNKQRLREKAESVARTGVLQFSPDDLNALQVQDDWKKPEWAKVVHQLEEIRLQNDGIFFAYIFRNSPNDPHALEFVADSHSLNPFANTDDDPSNDVDVDGNGVLNDIDVLQWPGQPYPVPHDEIWKSFSGPMSTQDFYEDAWGSYITGYTPIQDKFGVTVAVLAIDISPQEWIAMNTNTFFPFGAFLLFALAFLLVRLNLSQESLLKSIVRMLWNRKFLLGLAIASQLAFWTVFVFQVYAQHQRQEEIGRRLMAIAATAATQFDPQDLNQLHKAGDMQTDAYQRVFNTLLEIRKQNPEVRYAYILRTTDQENLYEFVADADSNYYIPFLQDQNQDGLLDEEDEGVAPGVRYFAPSGFKDLYKKALTTPATLGKIEMDQWGSFLSGVAPIQFQGKTSEFLEIDIGVKKNNTMTLFYWLLFSISAFSYILLNIHDKKGIIE